MTSYLDQSLTRGESVVARFPIHWTSWARVWLLYALVLTIPFAIAAHLRLRCTEYGLTDRRVVMKRGIVARRTEEMKISSIETVEIRQTVWGRILGYGNVMVTGRGVSDVPFAHVAQPLSVKKRIEEQRYKPIGA